ncbi:radical SAM protein [Geofilum rubicundum JCM 15548]|uniref:Radical SAM protein n=1 Tax=Geofilum rubicundum JCM 15548 TaxID=1236989 RepID=A0A0E9LXF1_9BACT|nr:radical SAM protein [Geofilum rubicundum JCM 15548]
MVTHAYHQVAAWHIDPVEKKPLFHFLPGSQTLSIATRGCNLRCLNCQNADLSQVAPSGFRPEQTMTPAQIVEMAQKIGCSSISYTYTEPTVYYELMLDTARLARKAGLKNIMVSSGYINPQPLKELIPYLDAANIDLKSFVADTYEKLCSARLQPVLKTLQLLLKEKVWLEITNLIIPGWTDDLDAIKKMCAWLADNGFSHTPLHFSRFFPTHQLLGVPPTAVKAVEEAAQTAKDANIHYVYTGNLPIHHREITLCHHCGEPLINRMGNRLITCRLTTNICPDCQQFIPGVFN